jgi:hypothetical protein
MVYVPTNPMFFHLLNINQDHLQQIRCEIQCLLTTIPLLTKENTMAMEVFSPSWIALMASNRLKRDHPHKYVNKTTYDIQPVQLIVGQIPPPIPKGLLDILAEFGLKRHLKLANRFRPSRQLYSIPQRRTSPSN